MKDLIERQAAIDACLKGKMDGLPATNVACDCCAERIRVLPSAQPDGEYISQQAITESDLIDWYINSVDDSEPVWTEEHIYELFNDFYLIPKENR